MYGAYDFFDAYRNKIMPAKVTTMANSFRTFRKNSYPRMANGQIPFLTRKEMIDRIVTIMPNNIAYRPYTMAKMLGVSGKTASKLVKEAKIVYDALRYKKPTPEEKSLWDGIKADNQESLNSVQA